MKHLSISDPSIDEVSELSGMAREIQVLVSKCENSSFLSVAECPPIFMGIPLSESHTESLDLGGKLLTGWGKIYLLIHLFIIYILGYEKRADTF